MLQWNPKLVVLVVALALIASLAAFGVLSFSDVDTSGFSW